MGFSIFAKNLHKNGGNPLKQESITSTKVEVFLEGDSTF